jgi:TRAP-type mannitol/chloroaromatic compound transport system permease small subunit
MWFVRMVDRVTGTCAIGAAYVVVALVLAMAYEVFSRYFLNAPTLWAFDVSYMMMGTMFFFGISYALRAGQHVRVDFLSLAIPPRADVLIRMVANVCMLVLAGWLTFGAYDYAMAAFRTGEGSGLTAWNPTIWPYRTTYVLGFGLFTLQLLAEIVRGAAALAHPDVGGDAR